jgi:hypothetical protein
MPLTSDEHLKPFSFLPPHLPYTKYDSPQIKEDFYSKALPRLFIRIASTSVTREIYNLLQLDVIQRIGRKEVGYMRDSQSSRSLQDIDEERHRV